MKLRKLNFLLLCIGLTFYGCSDGSSPTPPQDPPLFALEPAVQSAGAGSAATLTWSMSDFSSSVFSITARLQYDSAVVEFVDAELSGEMFGNDAVFFAQAGNSEIHMTVSRMRNQEPVGGTGAICRLNFRAANPGASRIDFQQSDVLCFDSQGNVVEIAELGFAGATITVTN